MSSINNKKTRGKLDKHSSTLIVLAFTVVCFLYTMFLASNGFNISYAAPDYTPPSTLTFSGKLLSAASGVDEVWKYMGADLALTYDFKARDSSTSTEYDMYCIEGQIGITGTGTYVNPKALDSTYAPGLAFILNNTYPISSTSTYTSVCGTDNNCKKYIAQYAVWYYLDSMGVKDSKGQPNLTTVKKNLIDTLNASSNGYAKSIINLVNNAKTYNSSRLVSPSLSIDTSDVTYKVTDDGKYIDSSEIVVKTNLDDAFKNYTLSIDGENKSEAILTDVSGAPMATFAPGSRFKVRIPTDKVVDSSGLSLKINVVATFESDVVYAYEPSTGVGTDQRPIISGYTTTTSTANLALNVKLVEITKSDITNGELVEGATLVITDSAGAEVARWVTDKNKYYISLKPGNYTLMEITSPEGYELNKETINFTVLDDSSLLTKVEMKNTPTTTVPSTASNVPIYLYIIGAMILIIGTVVICVSMTRKKS